VTERQRERRVEEEKDWQRQRESMFECCVFITKLLRAGSDKAPKNKICRRAPLAQTPTNELLSRVRDLVYN